MDETRFAKIKELAEIAASTINKEALNESEFALWRGLVDNYLDKSLLVLRMSHPTFVEAVEAKRERNAILRGAPHA